LELDVFVKVEVTVDIEILSLTLKILKFNITGDHHSVNILLAGQLLPYSL